MLKVAVFPVPDCAWAITSRPLRMGAIALCWIADGLSKPYSTIPLKRLSFRPILTRFNEAEDNKECMKAGRGYEREEG
jgi:hypothetical protein